MSNQNEYYRSTDNPVFLGKVLSLPSKVPEGWERHTVYRPKDTIFNYAAWPSVCCDENGTLYAVSSGGGMEHVCPFAKVYMYISKNGGKTWSPPIVVHDSYVADGHGGILYLGNGRLVLSWAYEPGDVLYFDYYHRINGTMWGGTPNNYTRLAGVMLDIYPDLPPEKLVGGSFVKMSDDYGMTWSDPIRVPMEAPHGPTVCKDGTLIFLGKEFFASTQATIDAFKLGNRERICADTWEEFARKAEKTRAGDEFLNKPIYAYASTDGGYTWECRGICNKPDHIATWATCQEPHVIELIDGSLLGAVRVEEWRKFENQLVTYLTRSYDGGVTWSPWECTHINGGPPHLLLHSSGAVILSVGRRTHDHLGEFAFASWDGGVTWEKEYVLDDEKPTYDLGYPCTTELPSGDLVTVYYQCYVDPETGKRDPKPSILSVRWKL